MLTFINKSLNNNKTFINKPFSDKICQQFIFKKIYFQILEKICIYQLNISCIIK